MYWSGTDYLNRTAPDVHFLSGWTVLMAGIICLILVIRVSGVWKMLKRGTSDKRVPT